MTSAVEKHFLCKCFFYRNYFLSSLRLHVSYHNREQFLEQYGQELSNRGISSEESLETVLDELETEKNRRIESGKSSLQRKNFISQSYAPLHPQIYKLKESFLDPKFVELVQMCKMPGVTMDKINEKLMKHKAERVFSFPVFTSDFCKAFMEELNHFEESDMPKARPNTMNNHGVLLYELGMDEELIRPLRENYLCPIASKLYPDYGGSSLDTQRAFTVHYDADHDTELSYHFDNAEVTINVSMSTDFEEGSLYFGRMKQEVTHESDFTEYVHKPYWGLLHRGQHMHGAMPISEGQRMNLIIWMRSSTLRNKLCPMCNKDPELIETEAQGDGFTQEHIDVCTLV